MEVELLVLLLLIVFSAFFSGLEIAMFSMSKAHLRSLVEHNVKGAKTVEKLKANPERLLVTILIGNNVMNIGAASMATALALRLYGNIGVGLATGVITFLILVFGEITPKTLAYRWCEKISLLFARPLQLFGILVFPVVWLMERISKVLTRTVGSKAPSTVKHETMLISMVRMGIEAGTIDEREGRLVEGTFRMDQVPADRVMAPRNKIVAVEAQSRLDEIIETLITSHYSRFPVYRKDIDNIVGIIYLRDIYEQIRVGSGNRIADEIAARPKFIPRTMLLSDLIMLFQRERTHMAIVIGEYGETAGLVTLEDVIEELVGEIEDEVDAATSKVIKLDGNRFLVDASLPIEDLNRAIGIGLPGEQHITINGLLLDEYQNIPKAGAMIHLNGHRFKIRKADARRILLVEIIPDREKPESPA